MARTKGGKKKALGRGLDALLGEFGVAAEQPQAPPQQQEPETGRVLELPLESIRPNPFQPRRAFDQAALEELAASIRSQGLLQPLVVRPAEGGYEIVAGERRLRACQLAGIERVAVIVREATDEQMLLLALLENLQREDLGPVEEARAYQRLVEDFGLTQEEIAEAVGKDRSSVANAMRLLKLPPEVLDDLAAGRMSAGHARALLALPTRAMILEARAKVIGGGLSVRATEALVRRMLGRRRPQRQAKDEEQTYITELARRMEAHLGVPVEIRRRGGKGRIVISFGSDEELERLLELLGGS